MLIIGKITGINTSDGRLNLAVTDKDKNLINLKISADEPVVQGHVYAFEYEDEEGTERVLHIVKTYTEIEALPFSERNEALRGFYPSAPISFEYSMEEIGKYMEAISNEKIKALTKYLIEKYHDAFFTYPAASKMHHAYVGGLAYHSIGMLHLADGFIENYPYLDKDYVYAGIMLHDIGKAIELTGCVDTSYSIEGQLLGHLVLGAMEIEKAANALGYTGAKEVLYLEHMLVSHHGMPQFGAAKKPMTAEALVLWHIDTIDSKFRVLGEELAITENESYTGPIGVLDRQKIYKM